MNNTKSDLIQTDTGVVQGSTLGPLLFNMFIDPILKLSLGSRIQLFADDIVLYAAASDISSLQDRLASDLLVVSEWLRNNDLILNINKSKYMTVAKSNFDLNLNINNLLIEKVYNFKYLGIIINNDLKIDNHLTKITKKYK